MTAESLQVAPPLRKLYGYLLDNGLIKSLDTFNRDYLKIFSREVLAKIRAGDRSWESMVPEEVCQMIKARRFLGYRAPAGE